MKRLLALLLGLTLASAVSGQPVFDGVTLTAKTIATGLDQPVFLTFAPGDPRLFVVEKTGRIRIIEGGRLLADPFLDLSARISTDSEQGLLGLAFHPDYARNRRFFVFFTDPKGTLTVAEGVDGTPLLTILHDQAPNHNGGWIGFGPDGLLYIGTGDGGGGGDPDGNAQNPDVLLGKLLRLNVDAAPVPEIFARGLRNPWRAAFDGDALYIGDVGQGDWEEVNILRTTAPGANLGWNLTEGTRCFAVSPCDKSGLTQPIVTYGHNLGCSVIGGYIYRGTAMPALQGRYFYSDFCTGTLMSFRLKGGKARDQITIEQAGPSLGQVSSFGQDSAGELYILTLDGTVAKLIPI